MSTELTSASVKEPSLFLKFVVDDPEEYKNDLLPAPWKRPSGGWWDTTRTGNISKWLKRGTRPRRSFHAKSEPSQFMKEIKKISPVLVTSNRLAKYNVAYNTEANIFIQILCFLSGLSYHIKDKAKNHPHNYWIIFDNLDVSPQDISLEQFNRLNNDFLSALREVCKESRMKAALDFLLDANETGPSHKNTLDVKTHRIKIYPMNTPVIGLSVLRGWACDQCNLVYRDTNKIEIDNHMKKCNGEAIRCFYQVFLEGPSLKCVRVDMNDELDSPDYGFTHGKLDQVPEIHRHFLNEITTEQYLDLRNYDKGLSKFVALRIAELYTEKAQFYFNEAERIASFLPDRAIARYIDKMQIWDRKSHKLRRMRQLLVAPASYGISKMIGVLIRAKYAKACFLSEKLNQSLSFFMELYKAGNKELITLQSIGRFAVAVTTSVQVAGYQGVFSEKILKHPLFFWGLLNNTVVAENEKLAFGLHFSSVDIAIRMIRFFIFVSMYHSSKYALSQVNENASMLDLQKVVAHVLKFYSKLFSVMDPFLDHFIRPIHRLGHLQQVMKEIDPLQSEKDRSTAANGTPEPLRVKRGTEKGEYEIMRKKAKG